MSDAPSPLRRLCWIFPDRESTRMGATRAAAFRDTYADVATDLFVADSPVPARPGGVTR
jgi:hypothetical protein